MVDQDILWAKISAMEKHLGRIMIKKETSLHDFLEDLDRQESILFNLHKWPCRIASTWQPT